jgi:hypothetical protein
LAEGGVLAMRGILSCLYNFTTKSVKFDNKHRARFRARIAALSRPQAQTHDAEGIGYHDLPPDHRRSRQGDRPVPADLGWHRTESVARMRLQNRFTGLDIARYTAKIMRRDMAAYDADPANYTQSLGCWHGFIGQQKMISIKKHFGTTKGRYLYLSGWMVAALRSEFGPLPDQSMHEKTSVPR